SWRIFKFAKANRTVFLSILGISWFWFLGTIYLSQLPNFTKLTLLGNEGVVALLLTLFSVGIGVGSLLCEKLSGRMVELGLVPLGSIGLTIFGIDLYFAADFSVVSKELLTAGGLLQLAGSIRFMFDIVMLGVFGGFYTVPLYALIQQRSEPEHRARMIACNNIINALFMVVATGLAIGLLALDFTIPQLFLLTAVLNALVAVYIYTLVPEFLMRFIVWLLIHSIYRVSKEGLDQIPDQGPAVLVCNHVSYVDALVLGGCIRRPVRFVAWYKIYNMPLLNFVFRTARAIPIASRKDNPALLEAAYDRIAAELDAGNLVCIFPEGRLTKDGEMHPFQPGLKKIIERNPVPVIPLALRGLWGSAFSRKPGNLLLTMLRRFWSHIELVAGPPVAPENVNLEELQETVLRMRGERR
ncbi:MAG: MFS transporter, partial [Gammaproteobacteria bacterium]|nr:MFS transporter [Gammaproteobacteria bacterium]